MKAVKNFLFTSLLVCSMALAAHAGEIDTPGKTAPPPPEGCTTINSTNEDSSAPNSGSETTVTYSDLLYDALTVIYSLF